MPLLYSSSLNALTRHGAIGEVGSLEKCLIIFHALRLLWVMLVDVMTSSRLFFFSSYMLFVSELPVSMVPLSKGSLAYCFLYSSYRLFDSSDRPVIWFVLHPRGIYLL